MNANCDSPADVVSLHRPAVTAGELAAAHDRLLDAEEYALEVIARALDECPLHLGRVTDVATATAALGPERARLARQLLWRLRLTPAPIAESA